MTRKERLEALKKEAAERGAGQKKERRAAKLRDDSPHVKCVAFCSFVCPFRVSVGMFQAITDNACLDPLSLHSSFHMDISSTQLLSASAEDD